MSFHTEVDTRVSKLSRMVIENCFCRSWKWPLTPSHASAFPQKLDGRAYVSTILFDNESVVLHDRVGLHKIQPMTERDYTPRDCTALLDAIGGAIHHYTAERVKRMIEKEKSKYGWEFLFLGANIDVAATEKHFGIEKNRAVTYRADREGTRLNYEVVNEAVVSVRKNAAIPQE